MSSSIADGRIYPKFRLRLKPSYEIQNLEASTSDDGLVENRVLIHSDISSKSISSSNTTCRIKYLVDTPEIIRGFLDKSMFLEAATRFMTAKYVHYSLDHNYFSKNEHEWNIVESFQVEISKQSRQRLLLLDLPVDAYADALAAVMVIDHLHVLTLFLDSRMSCILQKKLACLVDNDINLSHVISVLCEIVNIIQVTLAQAGELFFQFSPHTIPLLKKTLFTSLNSPASHLFGGIPNVDFEFTSWDSFRVSLYALFDQPENFCFAWFDDCRRRILFDVNGNYLIDAFKNAQQLSLAEKEIRPTLEDNQVLEQSLEWLNSVSGSKVISPWKTTTELVLGRHLDIWMEFFEQPFIGRMESIIESRFDELGELFNVKEWIDAIAMSTDETDYPGDEANMISSLVHTHFENVLEDLLIFFESPNASERREDLAPCFQSHCFGTMFSIILGLRVEMENLYDQTMEIRNNKGELVMPRDVAVLRLLSILRLFFAFQKHSERITTILGSPKLWVAKAMAHIPSNASVDSPNSGRAIHVGGSLKEQTSAGSSDSSSSDLEVLNRKTKDVFFRAHDLWVYWVSEKLSTDLFHNLMQDGNLSATAPLRGWEETVVKQEHSDESTSEIKILLPSMPSMYITLFLNQACAEIRNAGGHVLEKLILQRFASTCLEKVIGIYGDFLSNKEVFDTRVSRKGVLQIQLDLVFCADILSGADFIGSEDVSGAPKVETFHGKRQDKNQTKKTISRERERIDGLINALAQKLDPKYWLTYEPYLWENERRWYLRHAADFEFFSATKLDVVKNLTKIKASPTAYSNFIF